jgi:predicted RNA-binding Zn-ribbon protein involved in translation (DUF1610 family)
MLAQITSYTASCAVCKTSINIANDTPEKRAVCPNCGSSRRCHEISLHLQGGTARVGLELKAKSPSKKKPHVELKSVPSMSKKLGKPMKHVRLIDRGNDRYFESVTDYESGELIHHEDEPLSEHKGHGTAKKKT